jgi:hypothetical protein
MQNKKDVILLIVNLDMLLSEYVKNHEIFNLLKYTVEMNQAKHIGLAKTSSVLNKIWVIYNRLLI